MVDFSKSRLAAYLQTRVSERREEAGLYNEITGHLQLPETGYVLDVGTGTGLQLKVIHEMRPKLGIFGIDISHAGIQAAKRKLGTIPVDLRVESIEDTSFDPDFFDVVTCNASMSYWENPVACFNEIYRILKPGGRAGLFEPQKEIDMDLVVETIKAQLADKSPLRRVLAVSLNKYGLRYGRTLGLNLYSEDQLMTLAQRSAFGTHAFIERISLQNLPIFVQINLPKPSE